MTTNKGATERRIGGVRVTAGRIVLAVVTVLAVWFILINRNTVKIHLWGITTVNAPMWLVLLIMLLAGCLIGVLAHMRSMARRRR
ncbi:lipopolysaccharide assembly protein LapA domain-containing protein [Streptacidiphilus rugosus]|uniref:lipopolysaccharide assembly protein LapA domain-containing protein n=1 Tax=Streptacidiphilus rugosus TaxID=405783 RepID=UPI0005602DD8|nr:LapA family protein [Streptacidiphilus rugosus]